MAEAIEIKAAARERAGKEATRVVRREGRVPGVIYGEKDVPAHISVDAKELWQHVRTGQFFNTVFNIAVNGRTTRVIPRDVQMDPVRDTPLHVDFLRLGKDTKINVDIPVHFENEEESPGLKRGGVLNIVRHTIELICPSDAIPDYLTFDLTDLDIGDSIHISSIALPEGTELGISDRDFTVATIVGRMAEEVEEEPEEGEELEEGEEPEEGEATAEGEEDAGDETEESKE